jgi:hypothetical protein
MSVLRGEALAQATAVLATLEQARPGAAEPLRQDALIALGAWDDICVQMVADVAISDDCSVAGGYRSDTDPPTLIVARSASPRRRQFTALHELGHHLQRNSIELLTALYAAHDAEVLEEAACDAFAGRVLLPDAVVAPLIGARGPTADEVTALYAASRASRAACCVRAAERLTSTGAVFLLDQNGIVSFAIGRGMPPPARGSDQSSTPLVAAALRVGGRARRDTQIAYRDGSRSERLYGDCAPIDGWMAAVTVLDRAAWQPFAPPRVGTGTWATTHWWICEYCQSSFESFAAERCDRCAQPRCPDGHCRCTSRGDRTCTQCRLAKHRSQFSGGGMVCRDCRGE